MCRRLETAQLPTSDTVNIRIYFVRPIVPMEVLGLNIEREDIGQRRVESAADILAGLCAEVAARRNNGLAARSELVFSNWDLRLLGCKLQAKGRCE
jgi:hypothetical protein